MKSKRKILFSVMAGLLALIMILSLFTLLISAAAVSKEDKAKLQDLKDRLAQIKDERKEKEEELAETNEMINETLQKKYEIEQEIGLIYEQIRLTEEIIDTLGDEIAEKEEELAAVEETKSAQYELFKKRLRAQYESNGVNSLELIISSASMTEALARIEALNRIADYDNKLLDDLNETIAYIDSLRFDLENDRAEQEQMKLDYEAYRDELDKQEEALEGVIEELRTKADFTQEEIDTMTAEAKDVDQEMRALSAKIAAEEEAERKRKAQEAAAAAAAAAAKDQKSNASGKATGSMSWPLPGYYNITSDYKMRVNPVTGVYGQHTGIDIAAPKGTKIKAAASGTVVSAGWNNSYGWRVVISHGNGVQTLYAHMSAFNVSEGDKVNVGDVIGYVGSTGNSTGNHLHFSVLVNGSYVSPWGYVSV